VNVSSCTDTAPILDDWAEAVQLAAAWDAAAARVMQQADEAPAAVRPPDPPGC
jgi:hypothetical protein